MTLTDSGSKAALEDTAGPSSGRKARKADFILGLPREMGALEVVRRAQRAGLTVGVSTIYAVRKANPGYATTGARQRKPQSAGVEAEFLALAVRLGTDRARTLLDEYERALA